MKKEYERAFYEHLQKSVKSSASAVVPLLMELFKPESVVDFGCGTGTWLAAFKDMGVKTVLGFDGEWVSENQLVIDKRDFRRCDLACAPLVDHPFDLALSLEVAGTSPRYGCLPFRRSHYYFQQYCCFFRGYTVPGRHKPCK